MNELLVIRRPEDLSIVAEAWDRLRKAQPRFFPDFQTVKFLLSDEQCEFRVLARTNGDQTTCLACFVFERVNKPYKLGERKLFSLPVQQVSLFGSAILGDLDDALFDEFLDIIQSAFNFDLISFGDILVEAPLYRAVHARRFGFIVSSPSRKGSSIRWLIKLPKSFDGYLAQLSSKQRVKVRRKVRRLEDELKSEFGVYHRLDQVERFLSDAETISRATYQWDLGDRVCNDELTRRLYNRRAASDHLRCYILYVSGKPCAFVAGELIDNKFHYEMSGYDPQYAKLSPGTVLLMRVLRDLIEHTRCEILDFGQGGDVQDYKSMFGNVSLACDDVELGRWSSPYSVAVLGLQEGLNVAKNIANWVLGSSRIRQRIKKAIRKYGDD